MPQHETAGGEASGFDVFLCHNSRDKPAVEALWKQLRDLHLRPWLDIHELRPGLPWQRALETQVRTIPTAAVFVGSDGLGPWQALEIDALLRQFVQRQCPVIPVILPGCTAVPELPVFLEGMMWVDLRASDPDPMAQLVWGITGKKPEELASDSARPGKIRVSTSKLPVTGSNFVGREDSLAALDRAWAAPHAHTRVLALVAMGGVGKSALVNHWLDGLGSDGWRGAERVLGWSFYSQGTDATGASGDAFVDFALGWLGYTGEPIRSPWAKGVKLAELVRERRTLLVLDGLEPLQHPPGSGQGGRVKDPAVAALLRELAAASDGLCVVTTRVPVADLAGRSGAVSIDLDALPSVAGAQLLAELGVKGPQPEREQASRDFGGHALALTLLGTYLRDVCDGDVRRRKEVPLLAGGAAASDHARRVMESYENWLGTGPERQVLRLLGLFDRPAEPAALAALRAPPPIPGLTDDIGQGEEVEWRQALARLRQARLLAAGASEGPLDAHPLVREHFGMRLRARTPEAWRAGHERLYEHYKEAAPELPETLEAMMPLYIAVVHGCRAGREEETVEEVYWRRILRGSEHFSWKKLGAFGAELTALAAVFEKPWTRPSLRLVPADQAWLLNETGFVLRALGRLSEAVEPLQTALELGRSQENWTSAAIRASNLSELHLTLGDVAAAVAVGTESVDLADRSGDDSKRMAHRTTFADALHQAGRWDASAEAFRGAETMQAALQPEYPWLYSLPGYRYCDLLLSLAEAKDGEEHRAACEAVRGRASQTLQWANEQRLLLDIALDHLSLGRAFFGLALTEPSPLPLLHLGQAVEGLRRAGQEFYLPLGLLARATFHRLLGDPALAAADLREAQEIAERGHMRLFEADAHLEWSRLHRQQGDLAAAREHLAKGKALVEACGYGRRVREVAWLEERLGEGL